MEKALFRSAAVWTAVGLIGGLAYREITRAAGFSGETQLSVVHTHSLTLGTVLLLGVLTLTRVFRLGDHRWSRWFVPIWNLGLAVTVGMLGVKGYLQVQGSAAATSPAISGIAGLGHIILTVGFVLLLVLVGQQMKVTEERPEVTETVR